MKPKWKITWWDTEYTDDITVYANEVKQLNDTQFEADGVVVDLEVGNIREIAKH